MKSTDPKIIGFAGLFLLGLLFTLLLVDLTMIYRNPTTSLLLAVLVCPLVGMVVCLLMGLIVDLLAAWRENFNYPAHW
jgi:hypothetical protein